MRNLLDAKLERYRDHSRVFGGISVARCVLVAMLMLAAFCCRSALAQQVAENWDLEPGLGRAHLVMVARVASISQLTVVEGAKTDVHFREYRFQPVQVLKGIFQREQLSMTAADLGIAAEDEASVPPLGEGEFRLLILAQQQGLTSYGCVSVAAGARTFDERVPLVSGPDDPLVAVVETLIKVADSRSRHTRATLLLDRLVEIDGLAAVPLLSSLSLRADWAAADPRAYGTMARLMDDSRAAVRRGALKLIGEMLASRVVPADQAALAEVAVALRKLLESDESVTHVRLTAIEALGHLLAQNDAIAWPRDWLVAQLTAAATDAERAAAATALAHISEPQAAAAVLDALARLPLDEAPAHESVYSHAALRLDAAATERALLARLQRSIDARQSLLAEVEVLGRMQSKESVALLLSAAGRHDVSPQDRQQLARVLGRLGDDRAVPVLRGWLRGDDQQLKWLSLTALENLDSPLAAREARPLLKSEPHLPFKLRLARLLARHGFADGYPLATEHLADQGETAAAALVLAALDDPRTANDLSAIVAARPDRRWHAAGLAGLVAIGDAAAREQLLEILADDRHPLAADAAEAVGLSADSNLLPPLATLVQSRNKQIAMASLVALRRFLSGVRTSPQGLAAVDHDPMMVDEAPVPNAEIPAETRAAIAEAVALLVTDAYVEPDIRQEALAVARLLRGDQHARLLAELADQAELEGTPLLASVTAGRRRLQQQAKKP